MRKLICLFALSCGMHGASLPISILSQDGTVPTANEIYTWNLPLTGGLPLAPNSTFIMSNWGPGHLPKWMCTDAAGNTYQINQYGRIDKVTPSNVEATLVAEVGSFLGAQVACTVDSSGNIFAFGRQSGGTGSIIKYTSAGAGPTTFVSGADYAFSEYLTADSSNNLLVDALDTGTGDGVIYSITPSAVRTILVNLGIVGVSSGIVVDASGNIFQEGIPTFNTPTPVNEYTGCGVFVKTVGSWPTTSNNDIPMPMAYDPATGNFYYALSTASGLSGTSYQMTPTGTVTQFSTTAVLTRSITGPVNSGTPSCPPPVTVTYQPGPFIL